LRRLDLAVDSHNLPAEPRPQVASDSILLRACVPAAQIRQIERSAERDHGGIDARVTQMRAARARMGRP